MSSSFDYIIVGGGAAGCVFANRLSQESSPPKKVLLIEAGGYYSKDTQIMESKYAPNIPDKYFWPEQETIKQPNLDNRQVHLTSGKLLGGGTSINGEQFVIGTKNNFNKWKNLVSSDIWGPKRAYKIFNRIIKPLLCEDVLRENVPCESKQVHQFIPVRQTPCNPTDLNLNFVNSLNMITGFPIIDNYNNPSTPNGIFTKWQLTQFPNGNRASSSDVYINHLIKFAYVDKESCRINKLIGNNLTVLLDTEILRIDFNNSKTAIGVTTKEGVFYSAKKEVIVTCGPFSAELLLRSGIGPIKDLLKTEIPLVKSLPGVGKNVRNHTLLYVTAKLPLDKIDQSGIPQYDQSSIYTGGAFLPDQSSNKTSKSRKIELIGFQSEPKTFSILISPLKPYSTGQIRINPDSTYLVDFNYLSDPRDVSTLVEMTRTCVKTFIAMGYIPTEPTIETASDTDKLTKFIRDTIDQTHHWVGTNKMGPKKDSLSVVNIQGKVRGVKNLRIGDTSIMPITNTGNTQSMAYFIAHNICDMMLGKVEV